MVIMQIRATMTGSWFRTQEITALIRRSPKGEVSLANEKTIEAAERRAVRDQLHPLGEGSGLHAVSNGEQRKSSYTAYLPNRFAGFSSSEKVRIKISDEFVADMKESNPKFLSTF